MIKTIKIETNIFYKKFKKNIQLAIHDPTKRELLNILV